MVNDTEPRYRLVDANGTVVGSLFAESDGTLKLQEGTSGNDNELSLSTEGALEVEQATINGPTVFAQGDVRLSNNAIPSVDTTLLTVRGENGSADNLDSIPAASEGQLLILARGTEDITVRHRQDNIILDGGSDFTLTQRFQRIVLIYESGNDKWVELTRSDNI